MAGGRGPGGEGGGVVLDKYNRGMEDGMVNTEKLQKNNNN